MHRLIQLLAVLTVVTSSIGQADLVFVNRVAGLFDVPIYAMPGSPQGGGELGSVLAHLYSGETLLESTSFRGDSGIQAFYLLPRDVKIAGNTGQRIDLDLRFTLNGFDTGTRYPFFAYPRLATNPPGNLGGFEGGLDRYEAIHVIPEPAPIYIGTIATALICCSARRVVKREARTRV